MKDGCHLRPELEQSAGTDWSMCYSPSLSPKPAAESIDNVRSQPTSNNYSNLLHNSHFVIFAVQ